MFLLVQENIAQTVPFNCDYYAYLFQFNDVYSIDLASGNSYLVAEDITTNNINAAGYNAADGYIWGSLSSSSGTIVKIGKDYQVSTHTIANLPFGSGYIGDITPSGIYYLKNGGNAFAMIDLDPASVNYLTYIGSLTLSQSITIHDCAFNAVDGKLYTVEKGSNKLYRIDSTTGNVEVVTTEPAITAELSSVNPGNSKLTRI